LTASIFKEIHNLGNWVVNYDELLDRRQLLNQNVKVIRYKQCATQGRNILISSTAPLSLLRSMVFGRIKDLNLELSDDGYAQTHRALHQRRQRHIRRSRPACG
jgi:S-DNA-T family DNA segregation ATPase FtsK/SpoIIIE